jgi:hypothetical protein
MSQTPDTSTLDFENDIPESLARAAHSGTSYAPDERARQERDRYAKIMHDDYEFFRQQAEQGGTLDLLEQEFARYREGVSARERQHLASRSRCLSPMITGPANFPTERNSKRCDRADRAWNELIEYRKRAQAAILRTLRPDLQPIRTSDSNAIERLRDQLAQLEAAQARMREANAMIRKCKKDGREAQIAALLRMGISEKVAQELLVPDFARRVGFADYQLQNNNASIRRVKSRIEAVGQAQAAPVTENHGSMARVQDDPPANRVRLLFTSKPAPGVIATLKENAFRWTPSLGAWQAYRNPRSIALAHQLAGIP